MFCFVDADFGTGNPVWKCHAKIVCFEKAKPGSAAAWLCRVATVRRRSRAGRPLADTDISFMSETRKANVPESTYFVTLTVVDWIDVFSRQDYSDELIKNLHYCQKNKCLEVFAYVVMTSHVHLVCRRTEGLLSDLLRDFKSYTAKRIITQIIDNPQESRKKWLMQSFAYHAKVQEQNAEYMFWQKTNHPTAILSQYVFRQKMDYIHNNPVVAGIVTDPSCYHYSSANPMSSLKMNEY